MCRDRMGAGLLLFWAIILLAAKCTTSPSTIPGTQPPSLHHGLIYYSNRPDSNGLAGSEFGGLYLIDLVTKEEKHLTEDRVVSQYESFSWSPITRQLIYTQRGNDRSNENELELYLLDLNGANIRLTNNDVNDRDGQWSPDGQSIVFWSSQSDNRWLYLMDPDGSNVRPVFDDNQKLRLSPSFVWAPNSQKLAVSTVHSYTLPVDLNNLPHSFQIVEVDSKKILSRLPDDRVRIDFSWSPDSNQLVYLSDPVDLSSFQKVYTTMYILDTRTWDENVIAEFAVIGTPRWSPIEEVIAFSAITSEEMSREELNLNVYLINSDGTGLRQITDQGFYRVASWSPDGRKLALEAIGGRLDEVEIYVLDIGSGMLEQVTDNDVYDAFPIWVELK